MCNRSGKGIRKRGAGKGSRDEERHTKGSNLGIGVSFDAKRGGKNYKARIHFRRRELVVGRYKTALEACLAHDQAIRMLSCLRDIRTNYEEGKHNFYDPSVDAKMRALLVSMDLAPAPATSMQTPPANVAGPECSSSAPEPVAADVADCPTSSGSRSPCSDHASYTQDDGVSTHTPSAVASPSAAAPAAAPTNRAPANNTPAPEAVSGVGSPDTSAAAAGTQLVPCTNSSDQQLRNLPLASRQSFNSYTQVAPVFAPPLGTSTTQAQATYEECSPGTSLCPANAADGAPLPLAAVPHGVNSSSNFYHHHHQQPADYDHACAYSCSSSHSMCTYRFDCYSNSSSGGGIFTAEPHAASAVAAWQYEQEQKHAAAAQRQMICPPVSGYNSWSSARHVDIHLEHQHHQQLVQQQYQQQVYYKQQQQQQQQHHDQQRICPQQLQQMTAQHMVQQHCDYPAAQYVASRPYDEVDALLDTLLQMPLDQLHALA